MYFENTYKKNILEYLLPEGKAYLVQGIISKFQVE